MLNYILPPIIIIISVSALIMFLFRKAQQIPAQNFIDNDQQREFEKKNVKVISATGEFGLKLLERIMHLFKLWSLKFHNASNAWFQTIREKRQRSVRVQTEEVFAQKVEQDLVEPVSRRAPEVAVKPASRRILRPMVRTDVTMPQQAMLKEKSKLEDALIKRIAVNPRDIEAYERLGDYYLENENFQDSLECFKQVLRLSPTHQKARTRIRRLEKMK